MNDMTPSTTPPADPAALLAWAQTDEGRAFFQRASDAMLAAQSGDTPDAMVRLQTDGGEAAQ